MNWSDIFSVENIKDFTTIIGTVAFAVYMSYRTFKNKLDEALKEGKSEVPKNIKKQSVVDCEIIQEAEKLKELVDADRVQIYEFHNGTHYANGRSALKTSCTYEACRYGTPSYANMLSGIPLSCIPNFLKVLLDKGELLVKNIDNIKEDMPSTYNLRKDMNVKSFYDVIINNSNNEPVGFVAIQYCSEIKNVNKDAVKRFAWYVESKLINN